MNGIGGAGGGPVLDFLHGINSGRNNETGTAYTPLQSYRPASDDKTPEERKSRDSVYRSEKRGNSGHPKGQSGLRTRKLGRTETKSWRRVSGDERNLKLSLGPPLP